MSSSGRGRDNRRRGSGRNASGVPRTGQDLVNAFTDPTAPYVLSSSSTSLADETKERKEAPWHDRRVSGLNLFGQPPSSDLSASLLSSPSSVPSSMALDDFDEEKGFVRSSDDNNSGKQEHLLSQRRVNACSNSFIVRTLKNQHARSAIVMAINLLALAILYGVAINRLDKDYSSEPSSDAKNSMIDLNAVGFTLYYWFGYVSWISVVHEFVKIWENSRAPDHRAALEDIRRTQIRQEQKLDAIVSLFQDGSPLRVALDALATPKTTATGEDKVVAEITEQVNLARDGITKLDEKIETVERRVLKTQQSVVSILSLQTNHAAKEKARRNREVASIETLLGKTSQLKTLIAKVREGYIKTAADAVDDPNLLEEKAVPANDYDVSYMVAQVLRIFDDTQDKVATVETCKSALNILKSISEKVFLENKKYPAVRDVSTTLESMLVDADFQSIEKPEVVINFVYMNEIGAKPDATNKNEGLLRRRV
jgi:hypothetical protein